MRTKAGIGGIKMSPTLTPSMRAEPENMKGRSPSRENNDSLPIQIPRCDTHFVQLKDEKLIQLGHFFFLERNRDFVYHKEFGRRLVT